MKVKLTLTIDETLIPTAKRYAETKGISLSQVVENSLKQMALRTSSARFGRKWMGAFETSRKDSPRYRLLAKRYS